MPKIKRVYVDIRGGNVQNVRAAKGVEVIIRDWDNCPKCGTVVCNGDGREGHESI